MSWEETSNYFECYKAVSNISCQIKLDGVGRSRPLWNHVIPGWRGDRFAFIVYTSGEVAYSSLHLCGCDKDHDLKHLGGGKDMESLQFHSTGHPQRKLHQELKAEPGSRSLEAGTEAEPLAEPCWLADEWLYGLLSLLSYMIQDHLLRCHTSHMVWAPSHLHNNH